MTKPHRGRRAEYRVFHAITTRWKDNDIYGHVNNVEYTSYFDTAANHFLITNGVLDIVRSATIGIVVETGCRYHESVAFPDRLEVGLRVAKIGRSSVRYELAVFREGAELAAAEGHFVHVYVDRASMRPVSIPDAVRELLATVEVSA